jgi:nucleoside-diphosphate-sugar epimerase
VDNLFKYLNPNLSKYLLTNFQDKKLSGNICLIGDSGFIGKWFLFLVNELNSLKLTSIRVVGLSRTSHFPNLNSIDSIEHFSINELKNLNLKEFTHIIWGAASTSRDKVFETSDELFDKLLSQIKSQEFNGYLINLSSGAVYKKAFSNTGEIAENSELVSIQEKGISEYVRNKIFIENRINKNRLELMSNFVNARLFSFCGPGMPTGNGYAMSEFFSEGVDGNDIVIKGNPHSLRAYMHPLDLVVIIIYLICEPPKISNINIGSDDSYTIYEFARKICEFGGSNVVIDFDEGAKKASNYIPDITQQKNLLSIEPYFSTETMLENTFLYYKMSKNLDKYP